MYIYVYIYTYVCVCIFFKENQLSPFMFPTFSQFGHVTDSGAMPLLPALRQVLQLHGGALPASILGDELRRRAPELWKAWKAQGGRVWCRNMSFDLSIYLSIYLSTYLCNYI